MTTPTQVLAGDIVVRPLPYHAGYAVGRVCGPLKSTIEYVPLGTALTEGAALERARGVAAGRRIWLIEDDGSYVDRTSAPARREVSSEHTR
jgi:hypothetical protein